MSASTRRSIFPHVARKVKQCVTPFIVFSLTFIALSSFPFKFLDESAPFEVQNEFQLRVGYASRQLKIEEKNVSKTSSEEKYKILCSAQAHTMTWGSYLARCNTFKRWVDQCAPSVELTLGKLPGKDDDSVQYNATMYVKSIPPVQENLGKVFIDVVDSFGIQSSNVPQDYEVITQNDFQSDLFPEHKTHIIEHWYNCDPSDTYTHEIEDVTPLKVGAVCLSCPRPDIPDDLPDVNFTMIDEHVEGNHISKWFLKFMASEGWTQEKMKQVLADSEFGTGMLYYHVFRTFDVMIVTPKESPEKLRYGSIQRIVSVMKSGVPVLVEVQGPAFEKFVDGYDYSCVYSKEGDKYPSLKEALGNLTDVAARKKCQDEGLRIAEDFDPDVVVKLLLNTLGYDGEFEC
ncbi:hypothetical protein ACHAXS_013516 [Conticribra weissflogii]